MKLLFYILRILLSVMALYSFCVALYEDVETLRLLYNIQGYCFIIIAHLVVPKFIKEL